MVFTPFSDFAFGFLSSWILKSKLDSIRFI